MGIPPSVSFVPATALDLPRRTPLLPCSARRPPTPGRPVPTTCSNVPFSSPIPQADVMAFPQLAFPILATPDVRPELLGALLWTFGLYFGFSQRVRWAVSMHLFLQRLFTTIIPSSSSSASSPSVQSSGLSALLADALHWVPFFASGVAVDAALRYAAAGNAVWAVATGTSVALYAGVYELARQSSSQISPTNATPEELARLHQFQAFATVWLQPKGRCHFVDIRNKLRREFATSKALRNTSDEQLRRLVMNTFPDAKRSPNGFYRGVSVRQLPNSVSSSQDEDIDNSNNASSTS